MRVKSIVSILGKVIKPWKDSDGVEHLSYSVNIMQENGTIVDVLRLNAEQFASVEAGKIYTITADYGNGKNGAYLRITDIAEGNK
jgi:hypothetical protein